MPQMKKLESLHKDNDEKKYLERIVEIEKEALKTKAQGFEIDNKILEEKINQVNKILEKSSPDINKIPTEKKKKNKIEYTEWNEYAESEETVSSFEKSLKDKENYENLYNKVYKSATKGGKELTEYINSDDFYDNLFTKEEAEEQKKEKSSNPTIKNLQKVIDKNVKQIIESMASVNILNRKGASESYMEDYNKGYNKYSKKSSDQVNEENNYGLYQKYYDEAYNESKSSTVPTENKNPEIKLRDTIYAPAQPEPVPFEKQKFIKAGFFMKIGNLIGLSLRNQYYANLDLEVRKALENHELYRVLEAQKNGYFLGKKLNALVKDQLHIELTSVPMKLIDELVKRDILLSDEKLSLVLLAKEGKDLITNKNPEDYSYAKKLFEDLIKKENFLHTNKNSWINSITNKSIFLSEENESFSESNALFYHDKMLAICEKTELNGVKNRLESYLQEDEVLKSVSKSKFIDKMLLKLNLELGNSVELKHMVLDLPKVAQELYKSITDIKFTKDDIKILQDSYQFEYELVDKRMPEAIIKYLSVDIQFRDSLKNNAGKTAENLLIETLENILVAKKDLNLNVNQIKLSDLSVTRRYTDTIRGDIGKPSLVTLKTMKQLKDSGELVDLVNEEMNGYNNVEEERPSASDILKRLKALKDLQANGQITSQDSEKSIDIKINNYISLNNHSKNETIDETINDITVSKNIETNQSDDIISQQNKISQKKYKI